MNMNLLLFSPWGLIVIRNLDWGQRKLRVKLSRLSIPVFYVSKLDVIEILDRKTLTDQSWLFKRSLCMLMKRHLLNWNVFVQLNVPFYVFCLLR